MSLTEGATRVAVCTNVADCAKAAQGEALEWYPGAGEYCPECGEALAGREEASPAPSVSEPVPADVQSVPAISERRSMLATEGPTVPRRVPYPARSANPARWIWIIAGVLIAGAAAVYFGRRVAVVRAPSNAVAVCPIPSAQQLAADLVRAYAAKSAAPPSGFVLTSTGACDVRFSTAADSPDAVIARDGIVAIVNPLNPLSRISEAQLRSIFSGRTRDWAELGGPPGEIVRVLPDAASDEAKVLASSLFYGVTVDGNVRRVAGSAEVTGAVTGADSAGRRSIGIVAFSQSVTAKVLPLTYLPAPNVLSIASGRYPYTLSIAVQSGSGTSAAAQGLIDYARSRDGAAIVLKNGLIPREGF